MFFEIGLHLHDVAAGRILVVHLVGEELVAGDRGVGAEQLLRAQAAVGDERVEAEFLRIVSAFGLSSGPETSSGEWFELTM